MPVVPPSAGTPTATVGTSPNNNEYDSINQPVDQATDIIPEHLDTASTSLSSLKRPSTTQLPEGADSAEIVQPVGEVLGASDPTTQSPVNQSEEPTRDVSQASRTSVRDSADATAAGVPPISLSRSRNPSQTSISTKSTPTSPTAATKRGPSAGSTSSSSQSSPSTEHATGAGSGRPVTPLLQQQQLFHALMDERRRQSLQYHQQQQLERTTTPPPRSSTSTDSSIYTTPLGTPSAAAILHSPFSSPLRSTHTTSPTRPDTSAILKGPPTFNFPPAQTVASQKSVASETKPSTSSDSDASRPFGYLTLDVGQPLMEALFQGQDSAGMSAITAGQPSATDISMHNPLYGAGGFESDNLDAGMEEEILNLYEHARKPNWATRLHDAEGSGIPRSISSPAAIGDAVRWASAVDERLETNGSRNDNQDTISATSIPPVVAAVEKSPQSPNYTTDSSLARNRSKSVPSGKTILELAQEVAAKGAKFVSRGGGTKMTVVVPAANVDDVQSVEVRSSTEDNLPSIGTTNRQDPSELQPNPEGNVVEDDITPASLQVAATADLPEVSQPIPVRASEPVAEYEYMGSVKSLPPLPPSQPPTPDLSLSEENVNDRLEPLPVRIEPVGRKSLSSRNSFPALVESKSTARTTWDIDVPNAQAQKDARLSLNLDRDHRAMQSLERTTAAAGGQYAQSHQHPHHHNQKSVRPTRRASDESGLDFDQVISQDNAIEPQVAQQVGAQSQDPDYRVPPTLNDRRASFWSGFRKSLGSNLAKLRTSRSSAEFGTTPSRAGENADGYALDRSHQELHGEHGAHSDDGGGMDMPSVGTSPMLPKPLPELPTVMETLPSQVITGSSNSSPSGRRATFSNSNNGGSTVSLGRRKPSSSAHSLVGSSSLRNSTPHNETILEGVATDSPATASAASSPSTVHTPRTRFRPRAQSAAASTKFNIAETVIGAIGQEPLSNKTNSDTAVGSAAQEGATHIAQLIRKHKEANFDRTTGSTSIPRRSSSYAAGGHPPSMTLGRVHKESSSSPLSVSAAGLDGTPAGSQTSSRWSQSQSSSVEGSSNGLPPRKQSLFQNAGEPFSNASSSQGSQSGISTGPAESHDFASPSHEIVDSHPSSATVDDASESSENEDGTKTPTPATLSAPAGSTTPELTQITATKSSSGGHFGSTPAPLPRPPSKRWRNVDPIPLGRLLYEDAIPDIPINSVSELLGKPEDYSKAALQSFVNCFDFNGVDVDDAFRQFAGRLLVTGESQVINRILTAFARRYWTCNPQMNFLFPDYSLVDSVIASLMMLNTDLHRANIGARSSQKITKKQWVSMVLEGMVTQVKQHRDDKSEDKEGMRKWTKTVESMLKRIFDRTAKQALPQREAISLKPAQTSSSPGHPTTVSAPPSLQHQASSQSNMLTSNPSLSNVESDVNNPNSSGEATPTSPASPNMSRLRRDDSSMSISSNVSTGTMFSVSDKRRGTLSSFMLRRKNERPDARAIQFNPEEGTSGVALSLDSQLHLAGGETSRTRAGSASTGGVGGGGSSELLHNDHTHRHAQSASATIGRPSTAGILAARNSTSSWVGHNGGPTLSRRSTPTSSIIGESSAGPSLHPPPLHPQASVASNSSSATGTATTMGLIGEVHLEGQLIRKHLTDKDDTRAKYRKWMKLYTVLALDATHGTLELVMYKLDRATERDHAGFLDAAPPTHSIAQHPPETQAVQEPFVRSGSSGSHEDVGEPHLRRVSTYDQPAPTGMGHASGAWSGPGGERMRVSSDSVLRLVPRLSTQPPQSFNLLHSLATPLPPPGYSPQRPHVFTLRLCDGQIYLFHGMSGENVREWVKTINLWAARKSKEPFPGSGGNVEFGWGPIVADRVQLKQLQAQFSQQKEGKDTSSGNASSPDINKAASDQGSPSVNVSSPVPTSSASASPVPAGHKYAASVRSFASVGSTESGRSAATVPGIMGTTGDAEWSSLTNNQNGALGRRFAGSPAGGGVPSASATIGGSSSSRSAKDLEKRLRKMKIQEWLPPVPLGKVMSVVAEETQLENWRRQQEAIGSDLEEHSSYRDKMDKLYVNHLALKQKAQANWMRKQRWLMREYEKYGTYAQMLQESIVERYAA